MHACLLGHSLSSLQPGSGGGGTITKQFYAIRYVEKLSIQIYVLEPISSGLLGVQAIPYGSPVKPGRHIHIPLWFLGVQSAFRAQSQGSTHFSFRHVKVVEQSGSVRHSGRRHLSYGFPMCPGKQVHFGL